ncbi:hypothetical protein I4U23_019519 [Adineta vaga]|nr:hypothetical protein I4U23_019519 [Adineta vaga]
MVQFQRHNTVILLICYMSLCLIVHGGVIPHHANYYEEDMSIPMDFNGLSSTDYDNSNHMNRRSDILLPYPTSKFYDDAFFRQMVNHHRNDKRSKLNLHTNLNLPRYLRSID